MLHILILILKIIGIIIAVILGILLLLIAIFLFVPVHYEVQGRCDGDLDSLKGKVQVTWLLQLVRADILYKNGKIEEIQEPERNRKRYRRCRNKLRKLRFLE